MQFSERGPIGRYLSVTHRLLNALLDKELAPYEVTRGEFPFLMALYREEGVSQQELSEFYGLDKGLTARTVHALEAKGLVKRERDETDKRLYRVFLTDKGANFRPHLLDILERAEKTMMNGLDKADIEHLTATMGRIMDNLAKS